MKALKQTVARRLLTDGAEHFRQKRFYDFNVYSEENFAEKLNYMHQNPVKPGLVKNPEDWKWSSYRTYAFKERGLVKDGLVFPAMHYGKAARSNAG